MPHLVRLQNSGPHFAKGPQDLALSRSYPAGQTHDSKGETRGLGGDWLLGFQKPVCSRKAWKVFFKSSAIVIGPTPPGTGLMAEATAETGP